MVNYTISTEVPTNQELWELLQDSRWEFFGDNHGIDDPEVLFEWLSKHTQCPLFGYVNGKLATCTYLVNPEEHGSAAIHCFVHPAFRSPEHTGQLGRLCFDRYFQVLSLRRLDGFVAVYNRPARVMCHRLGMHKRGVLKEEILFDGEWRDKIMYSLLRRDFYGR